MATQADHHENKNDNTSPFDLENGKVPDRSLKLETLSEDVRACGCHQILPQAYSMAVSPDASRKTGKRPVKNLWAAIRGSKYDARKKPRGWRTMPYIMGNEVCEKLASIGLLWNLIVYLVQDYNMKQITASTVVNIVSGTTGLAPFLGAFIADAYLGRFLTILITSIFNLLGMVFLVMTATVSSLKPTSCHENGNTDSFCEQATGGQLAFLFTAFLFLSIGSGGLRPCTYAFGADQFAQASAEEKKQLQSFFNWYYFVLFLAFVLSSTVIVYIQQDVSWAWGFGIPAIAMGLSIVIFLAGAPLYRHEYPEGSIFTGLIQVVVASFRKRKLPLPSHPCELYDPIPTERTKLEQEKLMHTDQFRCLDKAAMEEEGDVGGEGRVERPWRLCPLKRVEELKCILGIAPVWASGILLATNLAQQNTFLVLQALKMDRHMSPSFQIPAGSMSVFGFLTLILWIPIYDRVLLPLARRATGNPRGISLLRRIGTGYAIAATSVLVAGLVESRRRSLARPMPVFWLVPQLMLTGVAESFNAIGQIEFFYDQMPASMRSVAGAMFSCSLAIGSYLSSVLVSIVQKATASGVEPHRHSWLSNDLDRGHLDYFYYLLATLLALNFIYFLFCTRWYTYKQATQHTIAVPFHDRSQMKLHEHEDGSL